MKLEVRIIYPASSGFSRADATLRRERNHCEHPSASLIEPPSCAMDEFIILKHVKPVKYKLRSPRICLRLQLLPSREPAVNLHSFNSVFIGIIHVREQHESNSLTFRR